MVLPGAHAMVYGMAWRASCGMAWQASHGLWYGLADMA